MKKTLVIFGAGKGCGFMMEDSFTQGGGVVGIPMEDKFTVDVYAMWNKDFEKIFLFKNVVQYLKQQAEKNWPNSDKK